MGFTIVISVAAALSVHLDDCVDPTLAWRGAGPGESIFVAVTTGHTTQVPPRLGTHAQFTRGYELVVTRAAHDTFTYVGPVVPNDTVWVVPWGVDDDCRWVARADEEWLAEGDEVLLRADRVRMLDSRRVVDVPSPYVGYPRAPLLTRQLEAPTPANPTTWLSPRDYLRLLEAAPRPGSNDSPARQLERFEMEYRSGPMRLTQRFPGPQLLRAVRGWAEETSDRSR